jgi:hypothetical protein
MADKSTTPIDLPELSSTPASPGSGFHRFYAKTDGKPYSKSAAGIEYPLTVDTSTFVTASSTNTFTNKTFNANGTGNSISNIEVADFATGVVDTDLSSVSASDDTLPSAKATKTALDTKQATLVSGTSIKTINSTSLLGSGDIAITGNATHTGDATGSTALTVVRINGVALSGLATGILKNTTGTGVPSIATAADITGNLITGYSSGSGTVAATDTILQAINKLNGNDLLRVPYTGATTAVVLGANTLSTTSGVITPKVYPASNSTTAFQINKANGTTNVLNVDTTNSRVGIGTTTPGYSLTVAGQTSITGVSYGQSLLGQDNTAAPYYANIVLKATAANQDVALALECQRNAITQRWFFGAGSGGVPNTNNFRIYDLTNSVEAVNIAPSGNMGINTTAPGAKLHVVGTFLSQRLVEANTAGVGAPNVLLSAESGTILTNQGVAALNYHTLPTAATGLVFTFYVQDADGLRVTASAGDVIRINTSVSATAGYAQSTTIGSSVTLCAINTTEWVATSTIGTWTLT